MKKLLGFTLIELLVVIAIIAILAAILTTNFVGARNRAYDVKAKANLNALKTALHSYYVTYHTYPPTDLGVYLKACGPDGTTRCTTSFNAGGITYLDKLTQNEYRYYQCNGGDDFRLKINLSNTSDSDIPESQLKCPVCGTTYSTADFVVCGTQ